MRCPFVRPSVGLIFCQSLPPFLFISFVLTSSASLSVAASISAKMFSLLPFTLTQASQAFPISPSENRRHHFISTPSHHRHHHHIAVAPLPRRHRRSSVTSNPSPAAGREGIRHLTRRTTGLAAGAGSVITAPSRWSCCSWSRWTEGAPSAPAGRRAPR